MVRTWAGLSIARFRFRKTHDEVISFVNAFSSVRTVLLVMPLDRAHRFPAVSVLELLTRKFREDNITVVTDEQDLQTAHLLPRSSHERILLSEVSLFSLPKKKLMARITAHTYDLAIDLNLDLVLPSAYICKASAARVRIGFNRKRADRFLNFLVQPDPALDRKKVYDRLVRCLQMF
jgi:ADP-heptose:LPS heptosyltransferase